MWRYSVFAWALISSMLAGRPSAQTPVLFGFVDPLIRVAVQRAVDGAGARLAHSDCQELLTDFRNLAGETLSTSLIARNRTPADAFGLLRFYDDRESLHCRVGKTLAFTTVDGPIVRVCGREFLHRFLLNRMATEMIVIHEFLHTLGLGENPPASVEITRRVAVRCGR
jgi:hypothetical protein